MPIFEGLFTRPWRFVDRARQGDAALRSDFDVQLDDFTSALNTALGGGITFIGEWDASTGVFPTERPDGSPIRLRDAWTVSVGGTVSGKAFAAGNTLVALALPPGEDYEGSWLRVELATIGALATALDQINTQVAAAQAARDDAEASEQSAASSATSAGSSMDAAGASAAAAGASASSAAASAAAAGQSATDAAASSGLAGDRATAAAASAAQASGSAMDAAASAAASASSETNAAASAAASAASETDAAASAAAAAASAQQAAAFTSWLSVTDWYVEETAGGDLIFSRNNINLMKLSPNGDLVVTGEITAFGVI